MLVAGKNVTRTYPGAGAVVSGLQNATFSIARGEFVSVVGPSGSGKSTLMNLIGLLDRPSGGIMHIGGASVTDLSDVGRATLRARTIGFVFQSYHLLPRFTAIENVAMPLSYGEHGPGARRSDRAKRALASVGLESKGQRYPAELSGGEQQRVAIARALVREPKLLLADEPTGALDSVSASQILLLFETLHHAGHTVVLITHDPQVAARAQRTIRLRDGRIVDETGA